MAAGRDGRSDPGVGADPRGDDGDRGRLSRRARLNGVYSHAPVASEVIAIIGVATALFAATIAVTQTDIKKVLAWSTISQLGYMFLALGVGAYGAAVFHLYTHAFFKACLFLGAGSVIHALSGEQDIRRMGGLARRMPILTAFFVLTGLTSLGLPGLSGFPAELAVFLGAYREYPVVTVICVTGIVITAFYVLRLVQRLFFGVPRMVHAAASAFGDAKSAFGDANPAD